MWLVEQSFCHTRLAGKTAFINQRKSNAHFYRAQELCESWGGHPGLLSLISLWIILPICLSTLPDILPPSPPPPPPPPPPPASQHIPLQEELTLAAVTRLLLQLTSQMSPFLGYREERKWRKWVDDHLVHMLSPNVYRTPSEALQAFHYFSEVGEWEKNFSTPERLVVIYAGAAIMYLLGKMLKKR